MTRADLEKIYLETTYYIFVDEEKYAIEIGKQLPSAIELLVTKGKSAAILTAWNPKSQVLPLSDNQLRNTQLRALLENHTTFHAVGQGDDLSWTDEDSIFIIDIEKFKVEQLAIEFTQYAYVWLEHNKPASLIFTEVWK